MKKCILIVLAALAGVSCNNGGGGGGDIIPPASTVDIYVTDKDGNDLINYQRGILFEGDGVVVEYAGKTYSIKQDDARTRSVAAPGWRGLYVDKVVGDFALRLGDFEPKDDYRGEKFTIRWNDGTSNEITFDYYFESETKIVKRLWLDGELVSGDSLVAKIVK